MAWGHSLIIITFSWLWIWGGPTWLGYFLYYFILYPCGNWSRSAYANLEVFWMSSSHLLVTWINPMEFVVNDLDFVELCSCKLLFICRQLHWVCTGNNGFTILTLVILIYKWMEILARICLWRSAVAEQVKAFKEGFLKHVLVDLVRGENCEPGIFIAVLGLSWSQ